MVLLDAIFSEISIGLGFGKHNYDIEFQNINLLALLGNCAVTFAVIGQAWSKTSFALTLLRISESKWMTYSIWCAIISINVFLGIGALFFWVSCTPLEKAWTPLSPGTCWDPQVQVVYGIFASGALSTPAPDPFVCPADTL
jgi:hypothetical protein